MSAAGRKLVVVTGIVSLVGAAWMAAALHDREPQQPATHGLYGSSSFQATPFGSPQAASTASTPAAPAVEAPALPGVPPEPAAPEFPQQAESPSAKHPARPLFAFA